MVCSYQQSESAIGTKIPIKRSHVLIFNLPYVRMMPKNFQTASLFDSRKSAHKLTKPPFRTVVPRPCAKPFFENEDYLTKQILTYIGNKRSLLKFITKGVRLVQQKLGKDKLNIFDVFSGSGIVARYFKQYADNLFVNDLEKYS